MCSGVFADAVRVQEIAIDEHLGVMEMYPGPCGKVYIGDKLAAAGTAKTMKLKRVEVTVFFHMC